MIKALKNYVASFNQDSLAENTEEDCLLRLPAIFLWKIRIL